MPTLLDYLGLGCPGAENLPGQSFAPLLRGETLPGRDKVIVYDEYGPVRMIRSERFKYVHRYPYGPHEFYDLEDDPDEQDNLIDGAAHQDRVYEMRAQLEAWFVRYVDPMVDGVREPVTGKGQLGLAGPAGAGEVNFADDWYYLTSGTKPES
jgi:arylsulfatase A-like enzyme